MAQIIPTILVKNFSEFKDAVKKIEDDFEIAQIDVMDGKFVKNTTYYNLEEILEMETKLQFELHLMVKNPIPYIHESEISNSIRRILFHYEAVENHEEVIHLIHSVGKEAGIVLNPETRTDKIKDLIKDVEVVMLMGVNPGFSGQKFLEETIERVSKIHEMASDIAISVDGGIDDTNAGQLIQAGAVMLSVNSFLYKGDPFKQQKILLGNDDGN